MSDSQPNEPGEHLGDPGVPPGPHRDADASGPAGESPSTSRPSPAGDPMETPSRAIRPRGTETAREIARVAARVALENRAQDVVVLDVSGQSAEFDYFVLATGRSRRQLHAISEEIDDALEKGMEERRLGIEGYQESNWIVLDYAVVVVHLFDEQTREYYDLESLWADAKAVPLESLGLKPDGSSS